MVFIIFNPILRLQDGILARTFASGRFWRGRVRYPRDPELKLRPKIVGLGPSNRRGSVCGVNMKTVVGLCPRAGPNLWR